MDSESGMNHLKAFLEKEASRGRAARWYVIGLDDDEDRYSLAHFLHMSNDNLMMLLGKCGFSYLNHKQEVCYAQDKMKVWFWP